MGCFNLALVEGLESRRLMSVFLTSGGLCLPPGRPSSSGQSQPPTPPPAPAPAPTPVTKHHHRQPTKPTVGDAAPVALVPFLLGEWSGNHVTNDAVDGSLAVRVSQSRTGELFAKVAFTGAVSFQGTAQLTYSGKTGQFTLFVVSPKLVVKFSGSVVTAKREYPGFQGTLQSYTRKGAYKAAFTLEKTIQPVNLA